MKLQFGSHDNTAVIVYAGDYSNEKYPGHKRKDIKTLDKICQGDFIRANDRGAGRIGTSFTIELVSGRAQMEVYPGGLCRDTGCLSFSFLLGYSCYAEAFFECKRKKEQNSEHEIHQ